MQEGIDQCQPVYPTSGRSNLPVALYFIFCDTNTEKPKPNQYTPFARFRLGTLCLFLKELLCCGFELILRQPQKLDNVYHPKDFSFLHIRVTVTLLCANYLFSVGCISTLKLE